MKLGKRSFYFLVLVIYIAMSARSCTDVEDMGQSAFQEQISLIESGMETDIPDIKSLIAFEEKARQKVLEYGDYLSIMTDNALDSFFRAKVGDQFIALFTDDQVSLELNISKDSKSQHYSISELIRRISEPGQGKVIIYNDSVMIVQHLVNINPHLYQGKINFNQNIQVGSPDASPLSAIYTQELDFYLKKIEKQFGDNSKKVWQVFLGDIRNKGNENA